MDIASLIKGIAEKAIWGVVAAIAVFLVGRWKGWWGQATRRGKLLAGFGAAVLTGAAIAALYMAMRPPTPERAAKFAILVAELDGDTDKSQTRHVVHTLRAQFGEAIERRDLQVMTRGETLHLPAGDIRAAEIAMQNQGQAWLKEQNADVLIWGEVGANDKILRLRFLQTQGYSGSAKPYDLSEKLELPADFGADLGMVIAAQAASAIAPVYARPGEALAKLIEPVLAKLKPLAENPPASFAGEARAEVWHAYAAGEKRLGEERGENVRLETAIGFYRRVLDLRTRERVPLGWATTQNNLGNSLTSLGERESGTARLEEAVAAYREALKERTRERIPLGWAMTQNNLGTALGSLGERESGTARLEEAVVAYREALKEYTCERVPLHWAATQNNLGNALARLGGRQSGTALLEQAVAAYREALKENTRERVPLDWAMTQSNLGNVLRSLGERESGTARLEEAVAAFRKALKEQTRERVPLDWAMTQNNLGIALMRLGERESSTARLEEAVAAFRKALKEQTRERVPLDWAMTQNNLGIAFWTLGERQAAADKTKGCAVLEAAREHFAAALEEFRKAGAAHYVGGVERNIARLEADIARLCG